MADKTHRSAITGEFVTAEHAKTNPDTTVSEKPRREGGREVTGWQDALVVRDKVGVLWGRIGRDMWMSLDGQQVRIGTEGLATSRYSPISPADGQPIVRTVGDLTARHIGKRVRVEGGRDLQLDGITHRRWDVKLDLSDGPQSGWLACERDTPVEVLQ